MVLSCSASLTSPCSLDPFRRPEEALFGAPNFFSIDGITGKPARRGQGMPSPIEKMLRSGFIETGRWRFAPGG